MSKHRLFPSRLAVVCPQPTEAKCLVDNEDVVGAAPTGDAPTASELSTILLPTKVRLILETWRYIETYNQFLLLKRSEYLDNKCCEVISNDIPTRHICFINYVESIA